MATEEEQGVDELNGLDELDQQKGRRRAAPPAPAHKKAVPRAAAMNGEEAASGEKQALPQVPLEALPPKRDSAEESRGRIAQGGAEVAQSAEALPSYTAYGSRAYWEPGPGRPANLPTAGAVLNQRSPRRESLDASVAADLRLKKRLKRFALDNDVDHLPMGDLVTVAIDDWLTARGY